MPQISFSCIETHLASAVKSDHHVGSERFLLSSNVELQDRSPLVESARTRLFYTRHVWDIRSHIQEEHMSVCRRECLMYFHLNKSPFLQKEVLDE